MDDAELQKRFAAELLALEDSGAVLPISFRPSEAWMLLSVLQLALRHPALRSDQLVTQFATDLARNIEGRLCKSPVMKEIARRGWNPEYDTKEESEKETSPKAETRSDAAKQSAKRSRK